MFEYDSTGVSLDGPLLPVKTWFHFRITEAAERRSKEQKDQVYIKARVIDNPQYLDLPVENYLTFQADPKVAGAGMAIKFMKSLRPSVPWEGKIQVKAEDWVGRTFRAQIKHEEFNGQTKNKIAIVDAIAMDDLKDAATSKAIDDADEIPF